MTTTTAYRVTAPCVVVKGERGSQGIFYQGDTLHPWDTAAAGTDYADDTEITRLLNDGFIEQV
jgi:hypothetical protein